MVLPAVTLLSLKTSATDTPQARATGRAHRQGPPFAYGLGLRLGLSLDSFDCFFRCLTLLHAYTCMNECA